MKKKRTTVGERLVCEYWGIQNIDQGSTGDAEFARRIDSALKRAVREAYDAGWRDRHADATGVMTNDGWNRLARKYGMKEVK